MLYLIEASLAWVSIGSGNGLAPIQRQAITSTNVTYCQLNPQE